MDSTKKCVLIIDSSLPLGLIANTAAVLALTFGKQHPEFIGKDVTDLAGNTYPGITNIPLPILQGSPEVFKDLQSKWDNSIETVSFVDIAQRCKTYDAYESQMLQISPDNLQFLGIGLYGAKKIINKLTGQLPLLR